MQVTPGPGTPFWHFPLWPSAPGGPRDEARGVLPPGHGDVRGVDTLQLSTENVHALLGLFMPAGPPDAPLVPHLLSSHTFHTLEPLLRPDLLPGMLSPHSRDDVP